MAGHRPGRVGIVGLGNISGQYLATLASLTGVELVAVADRELALSDNVAERTGATAMTVPDLLASPSVDVVLNLTPPPAHAQVALAAIAAGKHVYTEKPLALSTVDAYAVLDAAAGAGVRVGSAPDTFLGTGLQTSLAALRGGMVGEAFAARAYFGVPGHEAWHPAPFFFYAAGGGPVLDMGPYYITALVVHLGPVRAVTARTTRTNRVRTVATGPNAGAPITVEVPTHAEAILEHAGGALSSITLSFETWAEPDPVLEIYGTEGTLRLSDPNTFGGPAYAWLANGPQEWQELPVGGGFAGAGRGIGLAEMVQAIERSRPHRASGELARHVLDVLLAIDRAGRDRAEVELTTTAPEIALVPSGARVADE